MADIDLVLRVRDASQAGLNSVNRRMAKVASTTEQVTRFAGLAGRALGGFAAAGIGGLAALTASTLSSADNLAKLSRQTGLSVEDLSRLQFAAEQSGTSLDTLIAGQRRFARVLLDAEGGLKEAKDSLEALGLEYEQFEGLNPAAQINILADALVAVEDPTRRLALAQEVLGRSGAQLIPLFDQGSEGLAKLAAQADATGNVMSTQLAQSAERINDTMDRVNQSLQGIGLTIVEALAPSLETAAGALEYVTSNLRQNEQEAEALEQRHANLAIAIENSTQKTLELSFGTVGLIGEYENLDFQLQLVEAAQNVSSKGASFLQAQMRGAGAGAYYYTGAVASTARALANVDFSAGQTAKSIAALEKTVRSAASAWERYYAAAGRARALGPARYRYEQGQRSIVDQAGPTTSPPADESFHPGEVPFISDGGPVLPGDQEGRSPQSSAPTSQQAPTNIRVSVELDGKVLGETVVSEVNRGIERGEVIR